MLTSWPSFVRKSCAQILRMPYLGLQAQARALHARRACMHFKLPACIAQHKSRLCHGQGCLQARLAAVIAAGILWIFSAQRLAWDGLLHGEHKPNDTACLYAQACLAPVHVHMCLPERFWRSSTVSPAY